MSKRFKAWRLWRRSEYDNGSLGTDRQSHRMFAQARHRRRSVRTVVVLLASLVCALLALGYVMSGTTKIGEYLSGLRGSLSPATQREAPANSGAIPKRRSASEAIPEQISSSPAAVAYWIVASEIPGIDAKSVKGVYESKLDPSWASVRIEGPEDEGTYVVFLQRYGDSWKARKSIRADAPDHPEYNKVVLDEVPKDLVDSIYPQSLAASSSGSKPSGLLAQPVDSGALPSVEAAEPPTPEVDTNEVPEDQRGRVDKGLEDVRQEIETYADDHKGTAGVYVQDLKGSFGYGVNPDETFFGASIMKIPLMITLFRKIDEGEISLRDSFATEPGDWAAGAGWLQWEDAGKSHTVEDYLWMMITQSDNVATNALLRLVGGPESVNQVANSLGAPNTVLYQKVSSAQAAVPDLDNRTTPRDMATLLTKIYTGVAANPESCQKMIEVMYQNHLQSSLKESLPKGVEAANKGGWLYKIYDEVGIVWHKDRPYVIAMFSKHGSEDVEDGKALLRGISKGVYKAQDS